MAKYRIVGLLNFIFGLPILVLVLILVFVTLPKLSDLYTQSGVSYNRTGQFISLFLNFALGAYNVFLGIKLFSSSAPKFFKQGLIVLLLTLLFGGLLMGLLGIAVTTPIYQLTSQYK